MSAASGMPVSLATSTQIRMIAVSRNPESSESKPTTANAGRLPET